MPTEVRQAPMVRAQKRAVLAGSMVISVSASFVGIWFH